LFFSATPASVAEDHKYNGDTQHNRTSLTACLIVDAFATVSSLFGEVEDSLHLGRIREERTNLLWLLVNAMKEDNSPYCEDMIHHVPLMVFTMQIQDILHGKSMGRKRKQRSASDVHARILKVINNTIDAYDANLKAGDVDYWNKYMHTN
jgi:hypothetical protein